ncbi:DUF2975 domain-containing protein [Novosphingobium humi]|uniref:DUF2975 domain-containing protein n=1 Tax=Novosphingobium humi TaxID=2282397 RepID=A0ABY7TZA6_9SPHN|nr:DUF2975 domain-containing protein [Novosphingobium humi]WCT78619.1 DUF2975 domain-containing protein [Novosphingobium humi]
MDPSGICATARHDDPRAIRLDRVRRLSGLMATASVAVAVLLGIAMLLYWCLTPASTLFRHAGLALAPPTDIGVAMRFAAFAVAMIPLGALIVSLLSARRCFGCFAAGRIFSADAARSLRGFALGVAAAALLKPVAGAILSLLLSSLSPAHTRALALNLGSDTVLSLLFAGMVAIIAGVLVEAADVAAENDQFV